MEFKWLLLLCLVSVGAVKIVPSSNSFARSLYSVLPNKEKNFVFSPLSLHSVLSLTYQGAGGETARDLKRALQLQGEPKATATAYADVMKRLNNQKNITLEIANKIYVKSGYRLKKGFSAVAQKDFLADVDNVEFARTVEAADTINGWVRQKTNSKIDNLVSPNDFDDYTRAVLLNAVYFKGLWSRQFNRADTRTEKFYLSERESVDCAMMHQTDHYYYGEIPELDAQVLRLNYQNLHFGLVVLLPKTREGIRDLERRLENTDLNNLVNNLYGAEVIVSLPRFKIESTFDLSESMKEMGLGRIFDEEADFSNLIDSKEPLVVSKVIQKAYIDVNEEGAEAAATSGVEQVMLLSIPYESPKRTFTADRPFIFLIDVERKKDLRKRPSIILFMGRMNNPEKAVKMDDYFTFPKD